MYFYYFTILFLFAPAFFETAYPSTKGKISNKTLFQYFVIFVCIIEMGLRWETGSDWPPYLNHFNSQDLSTPFVNHENNFEGGYNFLVSAVKYVVPEYAFFLFLHAIVFFVLLKKAYNYFTPYSLVALLLFYVTFLGLWGSNRQLLAASIGILGLTYFYERRWVPFAILLFLAFQLHNSSILLLIFIFLKRDFKNNILIITLLICLIIGFSSLPFELFSFFGGFNEHTSVKAEIYINDAKDNISDVSIFGLLKRVLIFLLFFFNRKKITKLYPKFNFIFNGYFVSLCFYFLFSKTLAVMISRGSVYFNMFEPVLLSYIFCLSKDRKMNFVFIISLLLYCFLTVNQSIATYPELFDPYIGLFFNNGLQRNFQ